MNYHTEFPGNTKATPSSSIGPSHQFSSSLNASLYPPLQAFHMHSPSPNSNHHHHASPSLPPQHQQHQHIQTRPGPDGYLHGPHPYFSSDQSSVISSFNPHPPTQHPGALNCVGRGIPHNGFNGNGDGPSSSFGQDNLPVEQNIQELLARLGQQPLDTNQLSDGWEHGRGNVSAPGGPFSIPLPSPPSRSVGSQDSSKIVPDIAWYKTRICRNWASTGSCQFGKSCLFAHGEHQIRKVNSQNIAERIGHQQRNTNRDQSGHTFDTDGYQHSQSSSPRIAPSVIPSYHSLTGSMIATSSTPITSSSTAVTAVALPIPLLSQAMLQADPSMPLPMNLVQNLDQRVALLESQMAAIRQCILQVMPPN